MKCVASHRLVVVVVVTVPVTVPVPVTVARRRQITIYIYMLHTHMIVSYHCNDRAGDTSTFAAAYDGVIQSSLSSLSHWRGRRQDGYPKKNR